MWQYSLYNINNLHPPQIYNEVKNRIIKLNLKHGYIKMA